MAARWLFAAKEADRYALAARSLSTSTRLRIFPDGDFGMRR